MRFDLGGRLSWRKSGRARTTSPAAGIKSGRTDLLFWGVLCMQWPGHTRRVEELVARHYASLYRYAFRLSGAPQEAEDLTQETFCQAQKKLGQLRDPQRARGWLFTILR